MTKHIWHIDPHAAVSVDALEHGGERRRPTWWGVAVASVACVLGASCSAPKHGDNGFAIKLPQKVSALSVEDAAALQATIEIPGVLGETQLEISRDLTEASGAFNVSVDKSVDKDFIIRLKYAPSSTDVVLLAELQGAVKIRPAQDNTLAPSGDFDTCGGDPCALAFDLNRSGTSNLDDLVAGFDPRPPPPFVDVAPSDLAFPSGIRLGTFSRQVIVVENTSAHPVEVKAQLIDAPGATLSPFETEPTATPPGSQRELDLGTLDPFQEVLVAVSFAPVNPFLTVGDVFVEARDPQSNVRQATRVRLLANVDGELQPPPLSFQAPALKDGADLKGFTGNVEAFPTTSLFNGLPVSSVASADGAIAGLPFTGASLTATFADGDEATVPADHAFLVDVPVDSKLAVSLSGLESDVDLAVFILDDDDNVTDDPANNIKIGKAGTSAEAVEHDNETGHDQHALVVIGRVELAPPPSVDGGLAVDVPTPFSLSSHVTSAPEFTAPLTPSGGPLEGGTRVQLRGKRFHPGAQITFADSVGLDCVFSLAVDTNETVFDCTTPPGSLLIGKNPATIVVANPAQDEGGDGQAATLPEGFTYEPPAPRLDQLLPAAAPTTGSGDGVVAVKGAFFSQRNGKPVVFFQDDAGEHDIAADDVRFVDSTRLDVKFPAHDAGIVAVAVKNVLDPQPGDAPGTVHLSLGSNPRNFTYVEPNQPAPTVDSVAPNQGSIDGGDSVTVAGAHFTAGATVLFGGDKCTNLEADDTAITCDTPARTIAGDVDIEVFNIDGQRATLADGFHYFVPDPSVTSSFPDTSSVDGGTFVVVTGTGFRAGVTVSFEKTGDASVHFASPNVNRVSTTTILAATPSVGAANAGDYTLKVQNLDGRSATLDGNFRFLTPNGARPRIDALSPNAGNKDVPVVVTMTGANFRGTVDGDPNDRPAVLVGTQVAEVTALDNAGPTDTLTFVVPTSPQAGPAVVRIIDGDGQSDTSVYTYFTVLGAPPVIDSLSPSSASKNAVVTLNGRAFDVVSNGQGGTALAPNARLLVGGQLITPTAASAAQIRFTVPDLDAVVGAAGAAVAVELTNGDGQSTSTTFNYVPVSTTPTPVITSVSPAVARVGATATLAGSGFNAASVRVGGVVVSGQQITASSATAVSFVVPNPGGTLPAVVGVTLTNTDGKTATTSLGIDAVPAAPPVIANIAPTVVLSAGGTAVVITGSGFSAQGTLSIAGVAVAQGARTVNGAGTQVTFNAPAHAAGNAAVSWKNPDNQSTSTILEYTDQATPPPPAAPAVIDSVTPNASDLAGGTTVTVNGRNFVNTGGVLTVAGVVVSQRTVGGVITNGAGTQVTFTAPPAPQGSAGVVVVSFTNPNAAAASIFFSYADSGAGAALPAVAFTNPSELHALLAGDEIAVVGQGLLAADAVAVADAVTGVDLAGVDAEFSDVGGRGGFTASDLVRHVRLLSPLPDNDAVAFHLTSGDGVVDVVTPPLVAHAPRVQAAVNTGDQVLLIGDHLNPNALSDVVALADNGGALGLGLQSGSETLVVAGALPQPVPGATITLALRYQDLVTGDFVDIAPPQIPPASAPSLQLSPSFFGNELEADADLGGVVDIVHVGGEVFGNIDVGGSTRFDLVDEGDNVVGGGTWTPIFGSFGEQGFDAAARLQFDAGVILPAGGTFRATLKSDLSNAVAVTDPGDPFLAVPTTIDDLAPRDALRGNPARGFGTFFVDDKVVVEDVATGTAVVAGAVDTGGCDREQPGCFRQSEIAIDTSTLAAGSYRVCVLSPASPVACPVSSTTLSVHDFAPCGAGQERVQVGSGELFFGIGDESITSAGVGVGDGRTVVSASLHVDQIQHSFDSDLVLALIAPSGQRVVLANRRGGAGDDYEATIFDDACATPIGDGSAPFSGCFHPEDDLGVLAGQAAAGGWTLEVADVGAGDAGSLVGFTLGLCVDTAGATICGDGSCDVPESAGSCPQDCAGLGCGNGVCESGAGGEDAVSCPVDCAGAASFANVLYTDDNCRVSAEHEDASGGTGDDQGGIAVNFLFAYYTGAIQTDVFDFESLTFSPTGQRVDSLFGDLFTGTPFALGDGAGTLQNGDGTFTVSELVPLDAGALTPVGSVPLSQSIAIDGVVTGGQNGVFAGENTVVLLRGSDDHFFRVDTNSGDVVDLGARAHAPLAACNSWASFGVTYDLGGDTIVDFVSAGQIVSLDVNTGSQAVKTTFAGGLGDMCGFSVLDGGNRWYWHAEQPPAALSITDPQVLGFCDAFPLERGAPVARSCSQLHDVDPSLPTGTYSIDPDGPFNGRDPFPAFCEMDFDGGGWTLAMSTSGVGPDFLGIGLVAPFSASRLDNADYANLTQVSSQVAIRSTTNPARFVESRPGTTPIQRLRANQTAAGLFDFRFTDWSGTEVNQLPLGGCDPNASYPAIYHACGNSFGLHLIGDASRFNESAQNEPLDVWLRDAPVPQTCDEVFAADPKAQDGDYFVGESYQLCTGAGALGLGDGRDGDLSVTVPTQLEVFASNGRTCPDAVNANVTAFTADDGVTLAPALATACLAAGDRVLLLNEQGTELAAQNVGNYEVLTVAGNDGAGHVTFTSARRRDYGAFSGADGIGIEDKSQRVLLQRMPQYHDVTVAAPLSPTPWNGLRGGVVAFFADGTVDVAPGGSIDASGAGYRGAPTNFVEATNGVTGEGTGGANIGPFRTDLGGGGGGAGDFQCQSFGTGGAGGGHASFGNAGTQFSCGFASGGQPYARNERLTLGGGGGAGGTDNALTDNPPGGAGGSGGGIVVVVGGALTLDGAVLARGADGVGDGGENCTDAVGNPLNGASPTDCYDFSGPGGGGAGGRIHLETNGFIGEGLLDASGGRGGFGVLNQAGDGGSGGQGLLFPQGGGAFVP